MSTTPIEMPSPLPVRSKTFTLLTKQQVTGVGAGFIQTIERSIPTWAAKYTSSQLNGERYQKFITFLLELNGAEGTFLGYDPRYEMPYAYRTQPVTNDPWTQTGQSAPRVTAANYANSTISIDRLQNGAIITPGDYISAKVGETWHLWRAITGSTVGGNAATIKVKPRPFIEGSPALPVAIRYRRACCEMKMIPPYLETDDVATLPELEFNAVQFFARNT